MAGDLRLQRPRGKVSRVDRDMLRLEHDPLHPRDHVRIELEVEVRLVSDVRVGEQADVRER